MPQKFVRVRLENGSEASVPEVVAETSGYKPLNKPTHGRDGRLLPPKHRVPLGGRAASADNPRPEARPASDAPKEG